MIQTCGSDKRRTSGRTQRNEKDAGDNVVCIDECKSDGYQRAEKQEILNNISSAKEHVQVAFESRGTGGDADAE